MKYYAPFRQGWQHDGHGLTENLGNCAFFPMNFNYLHWDLASKLTKIILQTELLHTCFVAFVISSCSIDLYMNAA